MKKILAVALLDCRRLGFGLVSGALVAGLIPSLASGLGARVEVRAIVAVAFMVVGVAAGASFGIDFSDGRSSFFFARPLATAVLIAGRFVALLALAAAAFFSFMASFWISSSDRSQWTLSVLDQLHAEALLTAWALALFVSLAASVRGRGVRAEGGMQAMIMIPVRLGLTMGAFLLVFGLFADLVLRAYFNDFRPLKAFFFSWVAASLVASCVGIARGRTERLSISRFQGRVMATHFALVSVVVVAAWIHVLHPGPDAIRRVEYPTGGAPDGRLAYVSARVDLGDGQTFRPVFILDVASGQAKRLNADPYQGPWPSADGAIMVWSEATPFFFRPLWRHLGGATTFRVRSASGDVTALPMPSKLPDYTSVTDFSNFGGAVNWVLPSPDGDVFAIQWGRHLTFTSRSRGEMSDIDEGKSSALISRDVFRREAVFLPTGELRASRVQREASGAQTLTFVDIDPKSASMKLVTSIPIDGPVRVQFDTKAAHALLTSVTQPGRGAFIWLADLAGGAVEARPTVVLKEALFPAAIFLADGRIAVATGGSVGAWQKRTLGIFSPAGRRLLDIPIGDGLPPHLGLEMFPGVLSVSTNSFNEELSLIDTTNGATVRRIPDMFAPSGSLRSSTAPGTPAARLLQSKDGKLYELPTVTSEPRLLLPLPPS